MLLGISVHVFEDVLVDTALLLLERCDDPEERASTVTKFVRVKESMRVEHIVDTVEFEEEIPDGDDMVIKTRPNYRTVAMRQSDVAEIESGKLGHFISVPQDVIRLVQHPDLVQLGTLADVAYGNKTGANAFFFLDGDDLDEWPIDERFLTPAIKSIRDTETQVVTEETTDLYLLDVREYVAEVKRSSGIGDGSDLTERVKRALERDGYDTLWSYVEHGEREGYHERNTCAAREVWFDLGDLKRPAILHPKFFNDRIIPMWNRDRLAPSNAVDGIYLTADIDEKVLIGLLNSTVHKTILECWGRAEGGGALQLMTYEMETLPIVNPASLLGEQRERLTAAVDRLLDGGEGAQDALDEVILEALGLEVSVAELQEMQQTIAERRIRSGDEVEVLMERIDEFDDVGTQSFTTGVGDDETATLGEFMDG